MHEKKTLSEFELTALTSKLNHTGCLLQTIRFLRLESIVCLDVESHASSLAELLNYRIKWWRWVMEYGVYALASNEEAKRETVPSQTAATWQFTAYRYTNTAIRNCISSHLVPWPFHSCSTCLIWRWWCMCALIQTLRRGDSHTCPKPSSVLLSSFEHCPFGLVPGEMEGVWLGNSFAVAKSQRHVVSHKNLSLDGDDAGWHYRLGRSFFASESEPQSDDKQDMRFV